jgi:VanZ family protein
VLLQNINRTVAWLMLSAIVVLTMVPPGVRPITFVPHKIEHAGIFLVAGISFGIAYRGRECLLSIAAFVFCAAIELAQLYVPGRHARLSDFIVDAIAAVIGIFVGSILLRRSAILRGSYEARRRESCLKPNEVPRKDICTGSN